MQQDFKEELHMCDTIAGELLISFYANGIIGEVGESLIGAIRGGLLSPVQYVDSLPQRVAQLGLLIRGGIDFQFHRLQVPVGEEAFHINFLQFRYQHLLFDAINAAILSGRNPQVPSEPNYHLQVVPNASLWAPSAAPAGGIGFSFSQTHDDYKKMFGWKAASGNVVSKRVLVVDSGFDPTTGPATGANIVDRKNFVDPTRPTDTMDDWGHGTAVVSVIYDLCPSAEFVIYKAADATGRASEWDTLAALAADSKVDLVNISLEFGLPDKVCPYCRRESQSSRSAVFENMIGQLARNAKNPLLIAAAGNKKLDKLSFPARFDNMVALISVNLAGELSEFTNRGAKNQKDLDHHNVFVLPGGEKPQNSAVTEYIGKSTKGKEYYGTSFSTAYASGIIAALWSDPANSNMDRIQLLDHLRQNADKNLSNFPNYNSSTYGNGMMKFI
jgi:subtilisin family serine protease